MMSLPQHHHLTAPSPFAAPLEQNGFSFGAGGGAAAGPFGAAPFGTPPHGVTPPPQAPTADPLRNVNDVLMMGSRRAAAAALVAPVATWGGIAVGILARDPATAAAQCHVCRRMNGVTASSPSSSSSPPLAVAGGGGGWAAAGSPQPAHVTPFFGAAAPVTGGGGVRAAAAAMVAQGGVGVCGHCEQFTCGACAYRCTNCGGDFCRFCTSVR